MTINYDVIVIGGGTGGYPAAFRAAQLGMTVACVERRETLGGTCLNVGCIPSKALLHSSELLVEAREGLAQHGIIAGAVDFDLSQMLGRKDKVVADLTKGVAFLFRKNRIDWIRGTARFETANRLRIDTHDEPDRVIEARKAIIIATGSEVATLPGVTIDERRIVSSTGALALPDVPRRLAVIGGGYIGLELGSVWQRLGSQVTVVEYLDRIVPGMDSEIATQLHRLLAQQGMDFRLQTRVVRADASDEGVRLTTEPSSGGDPTSLDADVVLVAVGRKPFTASLGLETIGLELDEKGRVPVGRTFESRVAGVYAVGDVIAGPMLAHKSTLDGVMCAEGLAGRVVDVDYARVPSVIYTSPEVATIGRNEEELTAAGVAYKRGVFPFTANSRARCNGDTRGMVKILADAGTDAILGVHIIGPDAGTMISEAVLAMDFGGSSEDVTLVVHPHPTLSESLKEAALVLQGQGMHI